MLFFLFLPPSLSPHSDNSLAIAYEDEKGGGGLATDDISYRLQVLHRCMYGVTLGDRLIV